MRTILIIIFIFLFDQAYCQDSLYRKSIDSILIARSIKSVKRVKVKMDSIYIRYSFNRKSKELVFLDICYRRKAGNDENWWLNYHLIDGKLSMLNKYNGRVAGDKKRANAFYYFKNGILVFKEENSTTIHDLDEKIRLGLELITKAPAL
jgi:hypothetical protein